MEDLEEDLPHDDNQGEQRGLFVLPQARGKGFDHAAHHILSPIRQLQNILSVCAGQIKRQFVNNLEFGIPAAQAQNTCGKSAYYEFAACLTVMFLYCLYECFRTAEAG